MSVYVSREDAGHHMRVDVRKLVEGISLFLLYGFLKIKLKLASLARGHALSTLWTIFLGINITHVNYCSCLSLDQSFPLDLRFHFQLIIQLLHLDT